jgi:hypothetical protein
MENFKILLILLWGGFFVFLCILTLKYILYFKWLQKLEKTPIPESDKETLQNIPIYRKLSEKEKKTIHFKIQRFKKEKIFIGVGLKITEEIKNTISFFACLPTLFNRYFCYPGLKYIYVYPHSVIINNKYQKSGIVSEENAIISGEATGESVIIVWNEAKKEIYHNLGRNVIIHEFAHELDFEEGSFNGIPPIEKPMYKEWGKIMFDEYNKFKQKILLNRFLGKYSMIDDYAVTNPSEFFAVLSEYYFSKPCVLKKHFPKIYKELKKFYKVETDVC